MTQERRAIQDRRKILSFRTNESPSRWILSATGLAAILYLFVIAFYFERGNAALFWLLIVSEVYHVWMALTYIHTAWKTDYQHGEDPSFLPPVDVFITVAGEPAAIVSETVQAAKKMNYPNFNVYILNDGLVAGKDNWQEIEAVAKKLRVKCITRTTPGGAKSGNINHALLWTESPFVAVFDADHTPHPTFLSKTMGYFADGRVGFVQTPQFYKNRDLNYVTGGAWEQQELFFGPIIKGKNRSNSVFMCGTNMVIRRKALLQVGGMNEKSITEDFLTSIFIHQKGWKSVYVSEVLADGLAPEDFLSYYKQQFRWSRGSLEMIFSENPLFKKGLSWQQRLEYLSSSSYYLSGVIVFLNALFPLIFFFTGAMPFKITTMALAAVFFPYIFLMMYVLQKTSNFAYTFRALAFSMGSFPIHLKALWAVLTRQNVAFAVTPKTALSGNFLYLVAPHFVYIALFMIGLAIAVVREGASAAVINNTAWALFNIAVFVPFIFAAAPREVAAGATTFSAKARLKPMEIPSAPQSSGKINYATYSERENDT